MTSTETKLIREHLTSLKVWIQHWEADRDCNLVPTKGSLMMAAVHADCALHILDNFEAERKETA